MIAQSRSLVYSRHNVAAVRLSLTGGSQAVAVTAAAASTAGADDHQPHLGPDLQAMIGQQLRAVYHEVLNEPVPDRFVRLLEALAAKQAGRT